MRTFLLIATMFFAASARADVSDSGNLTIAGTGVIVGTVTAGSVNLAGSTGTIVSQSSVTASAFFGDGSHLSGVASTFTGGTVANQTTFQSTVTVQGGAFSVGGSSFVVSGGQVKIDNPYSNLAPLSISGLIDSTYGTLGLFAGTGADENLISFNSNTGAREGLLISYGPSSANEMFLSHNTGPINVCGGTVCEAQFLTSGNFQEGYGVQAVTGTFTQSGAPAYNPALQLGTSVGSEHSMLLNGGNGWGLDSLSNGNFQIFDVNAPTFVPLYLTYQGTGIGIVPLAPLDVNGLVRIENTTTQSNYFGTMNAAYNSSHPFNISVENNTGGAAQEVFGVYSPGGGGYTNVAMGLNGDVSVGTTTPSAVLNTYYASNVSPSLTNEAFAPFIVNNAGAEIAEGASAASPYHAWIQSRNGGAAWPLDVNPLGGEFTVGTASFTVSGGSATVAYGLTAGNITVGTSGLTSTSGTNLLLESTNGETYVRGNAANTGVVYINDLGTNGTIINENGGGLGVNTVSPYAPLAVGTTSQVYPSSSLTPQSPSILTSGSIIATALNYNTTTYIGASAIAPNNGYYVGYAGIGVINTEHGDTSDNTLALTFYTTNDNIYSEVGRVTPAGNWGFGTTLPATTADVNGNAQFGSGATKSTFTATGELDIPDNTQLRLGTYLGTTAIESITSGAYPVLQMEQAGVPFLWGNSSVFNVFPGAVQASTYTTTAFNIGTPVTIGSPILAGKLHVSSGAFWSDGSGSSISQVGGYIAGYSAVGAEGYEFDAAGNVIIDRQGVGTVGAPSISMNIANSAGALGINAGTANELDLIASGTKVESVTNTGISVAGGSVTASAFFGDGSHLSNVGGTFTGGTVTNQTTFKSTVTVQGNAFSVGGSTFQVSASSVMIDTPSAECTVYGAGGCAPLTIGANAANGSLYATGSIEGDGGFLDNSWVGGYIPFTQAGGPLAESLLYYHSAGPNFNLGLFTSTPHYNLESVGTSYLGDNGGQTIFGGTVTVLGSGGEAVSALNGIGNAITVSTDIIMESSVTFQNGLFSIGGSSFVVTAGSATLAYKFSPGSISMTGSTGTFVTQSSVTASAFFGDGSHLTASHYHVNISSVIFPTTQTSFTNTSNIGSLAGSTITISIAAGSMVKVTYSCPMSGSAGNSNFINVAVNNGKTGYPMGQNLFFVGSAFLYSVQNYGTAQNAMSNTGIDGPYASATTLSYSLAAATNVDTGYLDIGGGGLCIFMAEELPQ